ncbi:MAG TPA: hypothetical protein VF747_10575 [Blastocatellia bacterium]|jgi:hypothetical protein
MIKVLIVAITLLSIAACGGNAPRPTSADAQLFSIISEQPDPAAGSTLIIIKFSKLTLPPQIKANAESLIASRKNEYRRVTVKSFLEGSNLDGVPFAVSKLENDSVETVFNASPGGSVRIPTH